MRTVRFLTPTLLFMFALSLAQPAVLRAQSAQRAVPPVKFARAVGYPSGSSSNAIAVADLNRDGKLDIVVGNSDSIGVLLGNGDGTFQPAVAYSGGAQANSLVVADVNGDGVLDVIAGSASSVSVFLGNGNGTFQSALTTDIASFALAVADVNHDNIPDVVVTVNTGLAVLLGNGDGSFKPPIMTATVASSALAVADLDRDGNPDVVIVTYPGLITNKERLHATVGLLRGNGDGTFKDPLNFDTGAYFPSQIVIADFNLDGWSDILVVNYLGTMNRTAGSIGLLVNYQLDHFFTEEVSVGGHSAYGVAIGDLNGDGVPDFAIGIGGAIVTDLVGGQRRHQPVSGDSAIVIADLNGDHQPDLVSVSPCFNYPTCSMGGAEVVLSKAFPSATTVTSSLNPAPSGEGVTFTATIASDRGAPPDGITVTFFDGATKLGTGTTSGGAATFTTSTLKAGTRSIKATFSGCPFFKKSEGMIHQVVNP